MISHTEFLPDGKETVACNQKILVEKNTSVRVVEGVNSAHSCRGLRVFSILFVVVAMGNLCHFLHASEKLEPIQEDYPNSLKLLAGTLRAQHADEPESTQLLLKLAEVYLDMGDDLYTKDAERLGSYEEGAEYAAQALIQDPDSADAHFLYAANLGHIAQLKGIIAAALSLNEIMSHVTAAVSIDSSHAPALHMLGMMYDGLPWIMGGDQQKALHYLQLAVAADRNYTHARINLAKFYLKQKDYELARHELESVLATRLPRSRFAWSRNHVPEAHELLGGLGTRVKSVGGPSQAK